MTSKIFLVAISLSLLVVAGCNKKSGSSVQNSNKVRVGYIGLTCEAPIYAAYEKGYFKEEGLEPELVKCSWSTYKDALALGSYDITHHLVMELSEADRTRLGCQIFGRNPPWMFARSGGRENEYSHG